MLPVGVSKDGYDRILGSAQERGEGQGVHAQYSSRETWVVDLSYKTMKAPYIDEKFQVQNLMTGDIPC